MPISDLPSSQNSEQLEWWKEGVVYQIYPRSFQDSNNDGIGDLPGITSRLDHLVDLGIKALWVSPFYPSPMADFGYDVANYTDVDPIFGTLDDFDVMAKAAHDRDLKVILDFVPNHTSDEHDWFKQSRSSRDDPKRDWYIWRDPAADGGPPNNWVSHFGGSAWQFDEPTGQYYLHLFLDKQPDLNWRNPEVVSAMHDQMRFWLDRGVDGFRIDVMWLMIKDAQFRSNPLNPDWREGQGDIHSQLHHYDEDQQEAHDVVRGMRKVLDEYNDRVMIGEIYLPFKQLAAYHGTIENPEAHMPFNFSLILSDWNADTVANKIQEYVEALPEGAWPNWVLGNHDQSRIASRAGPDQAAVAMTMLMTLRGTPTMYYGDEIGMQDVPIPLDKMQDPAGIREPGSGRDRDKERTPMQWDRSDKAGFTTGTPWLPLADNALTVNVADQTGDPTSMLNLTRSLTALRRMKVLTGGAMEKVRTYGGNVLAFDRVTEKERVTVLLNMSATPQPVPDVHGKLLLETGLDSFNNGVLAPNRGIILAV